MKVFAAIVVLFAAIACVAAAGGYGGGASIPAPPCPKNYLFSCQPNLAPAPCAQPPPSYGSAGAYSENVPNYVATPYVGVQGLTGFQGIQGIQGIQYQ